MALIKSVRGFTPKIGNDTYLADNATIIGDVEIGDGCSIWFGTVLRGDVNSIRIGNGVNIQDGSVLHTLYEKSTIEIGNNVSVGHNVVIHGAKDFRIPEEQGMGAFNSAILKGVPSRFLYFPEENHWVLKPQNGILWHREFYGWLDKWLKN